MTLIFSRLFGFGLVSSVFFLSSQFFGRAVGTIDVIGFSLTVQRMSGNWIASVCRLRARASNYLPPILLISFTSSVCSLNRSRACVAYLNKRNRCVCVQKLFAASPLLGTP